MLAVKRKLYQKKKGVANNKKAGSTHKKRVNGLTRVKGRNREIKLMPSNYITVFCKNISQDLYFISPGGIKVAEGDHVLCSA